MKAEIITIGDEILIGQIVDTNSAWISRHLNLAGIEVFQITSVHDDREHILKALDDAGGRADLVLVTGGLGPTRDDLTKAVLCEFFHTKLEFHQPTFDHIIDLFKNRGIPLSRLNREQAMVPATCTVIPNINGTAPGMWFEHNGTIYVSMPGVPFEMETIVTGEIIPRLTATGKTGFIHHKTVLTQGIPESLLSEIIEEWENQLPPHIRLAYLPSPMAVKLRLSAYGDDPGKLERDVEEQIRGLLPLVGESVYGYDNDTLAMAVGRLLLEKKRHTFGGGKLHGRKHRPFDNPYSGKFKMVQRIPYRLLQRNKNKFTDHPVRNPPSIWGGKPRNRHRHGTWDQGGHADRILDRNDRHSRT